MRIQLKALKKSTKIPTYLNDVSSLATVYASLPGMGITIESGAIVYIPVGFALEEVRGLELEYGNLPAGLLRHGLLVLNPGVTVADTGEQCVILHNVSRSAVILSDGDPVATVRVLNTVRGVFTTEEPLKETVRVLRGGAGKKGPRQPKQEG